MWLYAVGCSHNGGNFDYGFLGEYLEDGGSMFLQNVGNHHLITRYYKLYDVNANASVCVY
jgi:hypothetical protein